MGDNAARSVSMLPDALKPPHPTTILPVYAITGSPHRRSQGSCTPFPACAALSVTAYQPAMVAGRFKYVNTPRRALVSTITW